MKKTRLYLALTVLLAVLLAGCGGSGGGRSGAKKVVVGTTGLYSPFSYFDEDNNLTGYDVEIVRMLFDKIPDMTVEFTTRDDIATLFLAMDSNQCDMVANQLSRTPAREEKYLFPDKGYHNAVVQVIVNESDNTRKTLADFQGVKVGSIAADYYFDWLEEYNNENGNPYEIEIYPDYPAVMMDISAGRIAGTINDPFVANFLAHNLNLNIKAVGPYMEEDLVYFCFRQDALGQEIKTKLDKAMIEAIADGSFADISIRFFGADYSPKG